MLVIKKSTVFLPLIILPVFGSSADSTFIKSPKTAFIASVIPGGGQIYNGKLIKGFPIKGSSVIDIRDSDNDGKIEIISKLDRFSVVSYEINLSQN